MLEFVEGTLSPTLSTAVGRHIKECPSCTKALEDQSSRTRALVRLARVKAPDQWPEISKSIRRVSWLHFTRRYGLAAAVLCAGAALLVVAFAAFPRGSKSSMAEPQATVRATAATAPLGGLAEAAAAERTQRSADRAAATKSTGGEGAVSAGDYDALEADYYENMVGQFLEDGAWLVVARGDE